MSCNMYASVLLTREICESFKERYEKTGKRSLITFTSALASVAPTPGVSAYAASKVFNDYVAWGLGVELTRYKVDVCAWRAAGVATNIIGNPDTNFMVPTAETYVKQAFSKCTSGVHGGYIGHEMVELIWTNLNDIFSLYWCSLFFKKLIEAHAPSDEAKKAK